MKSHACRYSFLLLKDSNLNGRTYIRLMISHISIQYGSHSYKRFFLLAVTSTVMSRVNSDQGSSRSSAAGPSVIDFPPPLSLPPPNFVFSYPPPLLPRSTAPRNPPYVVDHSPARSGLRCRKCRSLRHKYQECPKLHGPPLAPDHHLYRGPGKLGSRR